MAIDIGDAVLTFLGDTTQLDQTFNNVGTEAAGKLAPASAAVQGLGEDTQAFNEELDATGQNLAYAGTLIQESMNVSRGSIREAKGEAALLGEALGIHLPRHVRNFVAEIPAIGTVLSAAFSATAVLFLIEALAQGIQKITEWAEHGEKVAAAWEKYDQTIFESSTQMQAEIDKQQQKLIEMTQGPVAALDFALKHLQTTAFNTFSVITKDVDTAVKAMNEASSSLIGIQFNVFKDAGKDLEKFRDELQKTMRQAAEKSPTDPFAAYNAAITLVQEKERELTKLIAQRTAASGKDASAAVDGLHAERQAVNDMLPVLKQGIQLQKDKDKIIENSKAEAVAKVEKKAAEEQLKTYGNLAKAHEALEKQLEKDDASREKSVDRLLAEQLKGEKEAAAESLRLNAQKIQAEMTRIDGEIERERQAADRKSELLKTQYDRGLISAQQYSQALKLLEQQEVKNLLEMLNRKQQMVILEAQNEAAQRGKILSAAEAKELKGYVDLENKKLMVVLDSDKKFEKAEAGVQKNTEKRFKDLSKLYAAYEKELDKSHKKSAAWGAAIGEVISEVAAAYAQGSITIGQALARIAAAEIAAIAQIADTEGTKELAKAFGSWPNGAAMAQHFASAALWFSLGGALSIGAGAMSGGSGGGSSDSAGGNATSIDKTAPANHPAQQPVQVINAQHFARGALVDTPRMAVVGDSREAIVPLDQDSRALHEIAEIVAEHMGGGGTTNNYNVSGLISADTLQRFSRRMNRDVKAAKIRVRSSDSYRVTRRG